jgi:hypothetical protein
MTTALEISAKSKRAGILKSTHRIYYSIYIAGI